VFWEEVEIEAIQSSVFQYNGDVFTLQEFYGTSETAQFILLLGNILLS
jgi:hypothetical protein